MPSRSASMRAGRKPAPSSAWRSVDASALGPACAHESQAAGKAERDGSNHEDPAAGADRPPHLGQPPRALGRIPSKQGVPIHDADIEAAVLEPPERTLLHQDLDQDAFGSRRVLQRPGGLLAVHDDTGPARKTRFPGELRRAALGFPIPACTTRSPRRTPAMSMADSLGPRDRLNRNKPAIALASCLAPCPLPLAPCPLPLAPSR